MGAPEINMNEYTIAYFALFMIVSIRTLLIASTIFLNQ